MSSNWKPVNKQILQQEHINQCNRKRKKLKQKSTKAMRKKWLNNLRISEIKILSDLYCKDTKEEEINL